MTIFSSSHITVRSVIEFMITFVTLDHICHITEEAAYLFSCYSNTVIIVVLCIRLKRKGSFHSSVKAR